MRSFSLQFRRFIWFLLLVGGLWSISAPVTVHAADQANPPATPVTDHPRLWLTSADLPRLRSWAVESNPVYKDGLKNLALRFKADMDAGRVPAQDPGTNAYVAYPTEAYAQIFAFMALVSNDPAERADYAQRARTLLMNVINEAAKGVAEDQPFRDPHFATSDRSRWHGQAFAFTVDWIYPTLSAQDKATIRSVFLRWVQENLQGYNHPIPVGVVNDPVLLNPSRVRWSGNNYYIAHMRNIGLMALAFDAADDPNNELRNYLGNATGAWLYITEHFLKNDGRGGLPVEGTLYGPSSVGRLAHFLYALHTAGQDDPAIWGPQVSFFQNGYWNDFVNGYLHSLSPATFTDWRGVMYQPAYYSDGLFYQNEDWMNVFGPLALYDAATGNSQRLQALRYIETHLAPGGETRVTERTRFTEAPLHAILYFLLFDPAAPASSDPRPALPVNFLAPGIGRILSRTGWESNASWFTYKVGWTTIDHQHGDGNLFEFYRKGEWLTKERTGYGTTIGSSDYKNTLTLENAACNRSPGDYNYPHWQHGSQFMLAADGDGKLLAHSFGQGFVYALGDATQLYNASRYNCAAITHASRSILWLQPDTIVVYDRAASATAGRYKRFWLNLPTQPVINGLQTQMTTASGQQLWINTLLPTDAQLSIDQGDPVGIGETAGFEPMQYRLKVEAPGGPQTTRFLHVLQGTDAGVNAAPTTLIASSSGTAFSGALVNGKVILFPVDLSAPFNGVTYLAPATATAHLLTGLVPNAGYSLAVQADGGNFQITVSNGGSLLADSGGVLLLTAEIINPGGDITPPVVSITSPSNGALLATPLTVQATASDDSEVAGVQFQLDGVALGAEDLLAPYSVALDPATLADGAHTLVALARDVAGNVATSAAITVQKVTLTTATFQTGVNGYNGVRDVTINNQNGQWNGGHGVTQLTGALRLGLTTGASGYDSRSLLRFENLGIPVTATVVAANLTLTFQHWSSDLTVTGAYLQTGWDATAANNITWLRRTATANWVAPGAGSDVIAGKGFSVAGFTPTGDQVKSMALDPAVVQGWICNPASNQGLLLSNSAVDKVIRAYSSEDGTLNRRPKLTITYTLSGTPACVNGASAAVTEATLGGCPCPAPTPSLAPTNSRVYLPMAMQ